MKKEKGILFLRVPCLDITAKIFEYVIVNINAFCSKFSKKISWLVMKIEKSFLSMMCLMLMQRFFFIIFIFHRKDGSYILLGRHTGRCSWIGKSLLSVICLMLMQRVVFIIFTYHRNDGSSILLDKPTGGRIRIEKSFLRVTGLCWCWGLSSLFSFSI